MTGAKMPVNPGAVLGAAMSLDYGTITGIDGTMAEVTMTSGTQKVRITMTRGKSGIPAVGETWILDKLYGDWQFAVLVNAPIPRAPAWVVPLLAGSWVNVNTTALAWASGAATVPQAAYYLSLNNFVSMRGVVTGPSVSTANTAGPLAADIFRLPAGSRPSNAGPVKCPVNSNGAFGSVTVYPDGYVRAAIGSATAVDLSGVRFLAEQ